MRPFKFLGTLPTGDWRFCLIEITGQKDVLLIVDKSGRNAPRLVLDDKLVEITA